MSTTQVPIRIDINKYVIECKGKFIALDDSSGGYPSEVTDIMRAKQWDTIEQVDEYLRMFENNLLHGYSLLHITTVNAVDHTSFVRERRAAQKSYEVELDALNKKYGRYS